MALKKLNASYTLKVDEIFENKGWEMEPEKDLSISLYNKYIDRLRKIPDETRSLFLELTERFDKIELMEITSLFFKAYQNIDCNLLEKARRIYFLPLVDPVIELNSLSQNKGCFTSLMFWRSSSNHTLEVDRPKNKSGENILAIFETSEYRALKYSQKFNFPRNYSRFKQAFDKEKDLLILVDDFVGTGDTADGVLDYYFNTDNFNSLNTIILCLVSLKQGKINVMRKKNVRIFESVIRERGISDFYDNQKEIEENISKVKLMEQELRCEPELTLGYKQSEALISILNKSPNNTLPVFWHETKINPAPFPRRKIFNQ